MWVSIEEVEELRVSEGWEERRDNEDDEKGGRQTTRRKGLLVVREVRGLWYGGQGICPHGRRRSSEEGEAPPKPLHRQAHV